MQNPKIALIGFPYDKNSSFLRGPAQAPPVIRKAFFSESSNLWSESGLEINDQIFTDSGDVKIESNSDAFTKIEQSISLILSNNQTPICLGGDHFITYPIIKTMAKKYSDLHVFHFDAHPDLYDELDGNRLSHACPFARIMENRLIKKLTQIGIRGLNGHQRQQADKFGVKIIEMKNFNKDAVFQSKNPIYISLDLDVLDPAFAPGVSHQEAGGPSTREVLNIIHSMEGNIVGADIVELNPKRDPLGITAMAAAKFLKEIAAKMIVSDP